VCVCVCACVFYITICNTAVAEGNEIFRPGAEMRLRHFIVFDHSAYMANYEWRGCTLSSGLDDKDLARLPCYPLPPDMRTSHTAWGGLGPIPNPISLHRGVLPSH